LDIPTFVIQPFEYRDSEKSPSWIYFPDLKLLFGCGMGVVDTLEGDVDSISDVYAYSCDGSPPPELFGVVGLRASDDAPDPGPTVWLMESGMCARISDGLGYGGASSFPASGTVYALCADWDYRVRHDGEGVILERLRIGIHPFLTRKLKEYSKKDGIPANVKREKSSKPLFTPEQALFVFQLRIKKRYLRSRAKWLMYGNSAMDANLVEREWRRLRQQDASLPYRKAIRRACSTIANAEAARLFATGFDPVCILTRDGIMF